MRRSGSVHIQLASAWFLRGEVGLIFAQVGLQSMRPTADGGTEPVERMFSAVTLMVLVTTFLAPLLLKILFPQVRNLRQTKADAHAS